MLIHVHNLMKRFGDQTVLHNLEFDVQEGEFVALLGPNGAGKSTFLRILASLSRPTEGDVQVAGFVLPAQAAEVRRRLGVVSHLPLLYGDLTAEENLRFFGMLYSVPELPARISEILEWMGLLHRRADLVSTFSRGMQQRLAIGRAALHDPQVLLLDEPYTGLDQEACDMLDDVLQQVTSRGRTVVMTSHDLTRTASLAGRFDVLSRGRIQASVQRSQLAPGGLPAFYRQALEQSDMTETGEESHD